MGDEKKVVVANPFEGGESFFSGLGFAIDKKPETVEKPVEAAPVEIKPAKAPDSFDVFVKQQSASFDAEVVRRTPTAPRPASSGPSRPSHGAPQHGGTQQNRGYQGSSQNSFGRRPDFSNNTYKGKPRPTPTATPRSTEVRETKASDTITKKTEILIGDSITVKEFSEKMGVQLPEIIKHLLMNKIMGGINTSIDFDTASLIAAEFNVTVKKLEVSIDLDNLLAGNLQAILDLDKQAEHLETRNPIVTIMGHVDHGKTSLLDYLRKTTVAGGEAGGITQSIGASQAVHDGKVITFIDTPGHELFTSLRARGSKITDIAVIVVAVEDGLKPQTIEAINHVKAGNVPFIIAITKIDKQHKPADIEKIYSQLAEQAVTIEERGGPTPVVKVSAQTGQGINDLLDIILLQAELLNLRYNPNRSCVGVVVDAQKDAKQGVQTSLIVMTGTLKVGDIITVHHTYGRVKRMLDRKGKPLRVAKGGEPVQILGIYDVPEPGRLIEGVKTEKEAQDRIALIKDQEQDQSNKPNLQALLSQIQGGEQTQVNLILKADGPSSLEALTQAVDSIQLPDSVKLKTIHRDIGNFSESDLALAQATNGLMIGFNVDASSTLKKKAEHLKLTVKSYTIIYELMAFLESVVKGSQLTEEVETVIGHLKVLGIFFRKEKDMVIGGDVIDGKIIKKCSFRVYRGEGSDGTPQLFSRGDVQSLQREQQAVNEAEAGVQCGMKVVVSKKIMEGDLLEFYTLEQVLR